jgi:hypothetical protein
MRLAGWGLVTGCSALVLTVPAAWPWRMGWSGLVLVVGGLLWRRYRRRRPLALHRLEASGLSCTLAEGGEVGVRRIRIGVLNPWLVSARLFVADGRVLDLFVPGHALTQTEHRRLRRALLAFDAADPRGDLPEAGAMPQSERRGGT